MVIPIKKVTVDSFDKTTHPIKLPQYTVPTDGYIKVDVEPSKVKDIEPIIEWLENTCQDKVIIQPISWNNFKFCVNFYFKSMEDAVLFRMTWL